MKSFPFTTLFATFLIANFIPNSISYVPAIGAFYALSTTSTPYSSPLPSVKNATLDVEQDETRNWEISSPFTKWFEYYSSTSEFQQHHDSSDKCASILKEHEFEGLYEVAGLWVACQDPVLPSGCEPSCHPDITYSVDRLDPAIRTVKMNFALYGLGTLRLTLLGSWGQKLECYDFSHREDPLSQCSYIEMNATTQGWKGVQSSLLTDIEFWGFRIDLIARFAHDLVLLDKVEATEYHLCDADTTCPTTSTTTTTPTPSTTPWSTSTTQPTVSTVVTTRTTTTQPTTPSPTPSPNITLDTEGDIRGDWNIAELFPGYLEYYNDSMQLSAKPNGSFYCGTLISKDVHLSPVPGVWAACQHDHFVPPENSNSSQCYIGSELRSCYPFIKRVPNHIQALRTVKISFFVQELAILRLTVNDYPGSLSRKCFDYSLNNTVTDVNSTCEFIEVKGQGEEQTTGWNEVMYTLGTDSAETLIYFTVSAIARFERDVVLINKVETTDIGFLPGTTTTSTTTATPLSSTPNILKHPSGGTTTTIHLSLSIQLFIIIHVFKYL